jgi:hypothetical protein
MAFKHFLGLEQPEPQLLEVRAEQLAEYVGRYEMRTGAVELRLDGDTLVAQPLPKGGFPTKDSPPPPPSPPTRVAFIDRDQLVALDAPWTGGRAEFLRNPDGSIAWLRWGVRLAARDA